MNEELGRALRQLWENPGSKIDDFSKSFEQLRNDLDTCTLQHSAIVMSKVSTQVGILGIWTFFLNWSLSQSFS